MTVRSSLRTIALEAARSLGAIGGETLAELRRLNQIGALPADHASRRVRARTVKAMLRHRYQDYNRCC